MLENYKIVGLRYCNLHKMFLKRLYIALYKRLCWFRYRRILKFLGNNSRILNPLHIGGGKSIIIGNNTTIQYKSWIEANPLTGDSKAELIIGNGCAIGHFNEIYSTKSIVIEDSVLTADRVYISDNLHGYENPDVPIINQPVKQNGTLRIGEGSWLGIGVCVIGANIGKHCVIGANAVVTHNIPDYSVAVGIPAKVVKRFNPKSGMWEKTNPDGSFL